MELRGVKFKFGTIDTAKDWKLTLNEMTLDPPTPKTYFVEVDGRDGDVDMSEALNGEIKYKNREVHFKFIITEGTYEERDALMDEIIQTLHGLKSDAILPDDNNRKVVGRWEVVEIVKTASHIEFEVNGNCDPWRYSILETIHDIEIRNNASQLVDLINNGRKTVIPEFVVNGNVDIEWGTNSASLASGVHKLLNLKLIRGKTTIRVRGDAYIAIKYTEAIL